jgi:PelA/Pel-15E family pectate lyase
MPRQRHSTLRNGCVATALALGVLVQFASAVAAADRADWSQLSRKPDDWYRGPEGRAAVASVLSHQSPRGDWPKNIDTTRSPFTGDRAAIKGTFDNGATVGEVRFLAHARKVTGDPTADLAVTRAIDLILEARYPTGGWPQSFPPGTKYHRYITFNDGTMVNLMGLLRDVATGTNEFAFVDAKRRAEAQLAFDAGIACILKCQVRVGGKPTVWCAQHDEVSLEPRPARTFEPVSLSGGESADILLLLMSLDDPDPQVVNAVEAGVRWFDSVQLRGIKQVTVNGDKIIVPDPNAPPLWARFYEIGTNRPLFLGRDGVIKFDLAAIDHERRNGYAWYGYWGRKLSQPYARLLARQGRHAPEATP